MLDAQRKRLDDPDLSYISIGITEGGIPRKALSVPWDITANAYNMCVPDFYIAPEDLQDPSVMEKLEAKQPIALYAFVPLEDYSFLSHFHGLRAISIREGKSLRNLDFLLSCPDWYQLLIEDAHIPTLNPLFHNGKKKFRSYCISFIDCCIGDNSSLKQDGIFLSELHILQNIGTNEKHRWSSIRCSRFTYEEYDRNAYLRSRQNTKADP